MKMILRKNYLFFECPAQNCGLVRVPVEGNPHWNWNGSLDKPTLRPSLRIEWDFGEAPNRVHNCCHFVITDGVIHFQADSTHELKGQKVPMADVTEEFQRFMANDEG